MTVRICKTGNSNDSIELICFVFVVLHIFLFFVPSHTIRWAVWITRNQGWLGLLEHLRIVKRTITCHAIARLEDVPATTTHRRNWLDEIRPRLNKLGRTHHVWIHEVATWALPWVKLIAHWLPFRSKEINIRIYLLLHLKETLHLEVSTVHALRATHYATYMHSVRICLHLVLVLLGLLQIPLTHHGVWIEIFCVLLRLRLRLDCRHVHSVLKNFRNSRVANLCLIAPVWIHHSIAILPHHVPLPVLISLKWRVVVNTPHWTVKMRWHSRRN